MLSNVAGRQKRLLCIFSEGNDLMWKEKGGAFFHMQKALSLLRRRRKREEYSRNGRAENPFKARFCSPVKHKYYNLLLIVNYSIYAYGTDGHRLLSHQC